MQKAWTTLSFYRNNQQLPSRASAWQQLFSSEKLLSLNWRNLEHKQAMTGQPSALTERERESNRENNNGCCNDRNSNNNHLRMLQCSIISKSHLSLNEIFREGTSVEIHPHPGHRYLRSYQSLPFSSKRLLLFRLAGEEDQDFSSVKLWT